MKPTCLSADVGCESFKSPHTMLKIKLLMSSFSYTLGRSWISRTHIPLGQKHFRPVFGRTDFRCLFLSRRFFLVDMSPFLLWEKVPRKILQENPRKNRPIFIQQNPLHISAEGPLQTITYILKIDGDSIDVTGYKTLHHDNCKEFIWCSSSGLAPPELWWHDAIYCSIEI